MPNIAGRIPSHEELAAAVDTEVDAGLDDLLEAIRIPSVVAWGDDHMSRSAAYLASLLTRDGWEAAVVNVATNVAVYAEIGRNGGGPPVIFYGHHDVQPPEPLDSWTTPPFEPALREGRIWGRGSGDNKGQFFAHIFAVRALLRLMGEIPVRVKFFIDGEEEAGNPSLAATLDYLRPRLEGSAFVYTVDGPEHPTGRPRVTFGFRGDLHLRLTVRTFRGSLHSGHWGNIAPDAAALLARVIAATKDDDDRVVIPGFYDGVAAPDAHECSAIAAAPFDAATVARQIGARRLAGPASMPAMERMMFQPTFTITGLRAGYIGTGNQFQNAIAGEATAQIDIRYVPNQDPEHLVAVVERFVRQIAPDSTLEVLAQKDPSRTPMGTPHAAIVASALTQGFGIAPLMLPCSGGSAPDSLFTRDLGIHSLWAHVANHDMRNHAPDENIAIDSIKGAARSTAALITALAASQRTAKQDQGEWRSQ